MTIDWINAHLPLDESGEVVLVENVDGLGGKITTTTNFLASVTASLSDPVTYATLSALPISSAGWQPYFDGWKAKGIIA